MNSEEIEIYGWILNSIQHPLDNDDINCLDIDVEDQESDCDDDYSSEDEHLEAPDDPDYQPEEAKNEIVCFDNEKKLRIYQAIRSRPNQSVESLAKRLRVSSSIIYNYMNILKQGPSLRVKFRRLDKILFDEFCRLRESGFLIRYNDLRQFALEFATELGIPKEKFHAGPSWLLKFKRKNRIVVRKITRFMTQRQFISLDTIQKGRIRWESERSIAAI